MSAFCSHCHATLSTPPPRVCLACGEAVSVGGPLGDTEGVALRSSQARLAGRLSDGRFAEFHVGDKSSLGRHPSNTVCISDREVSKEHATLERVGNEYVLRDLNSSNGTFVNGRRVTEARLRDGDEVTLGGARFVFSAQTWGHASSGVTVIESNMSSPSVIAQFEHIENAEFRPVEELTDLQTLKQDYEKLRLANEFHRQVGVERDPQSLLDKILKVAFQLVPADKAVIFLLDDTGQPKPAAVGHRNKKVHSVEVSDTVLQKVLQTRQAVLTADAILDSRFSSSESIVAQGIRSAMAVPLMSKGAMKGILFCDTRKQTHAFSEKDLKILAGVAAQAASAIENAELAQQIETEAVTRAELSRFLSKAVADMVVQGKVELLRAPTMAEVTVLFADIRGFTRFAELEPVDQTVAMLNSFFSRMANVVFRFEGNLDKFIGDCVMAVWGPPSSHPDDARRALEAAIDMQDEVLELNKLRVSQGQAPIEVGIGINTGMAVVGYMGSSERHEYTAIGDTVNVASRLCGRAQGGEILASNSTLEKAGGTFRVEKVDVEQLKGKEKGIATFRVLGPIS